MSTAADLDAPEDLDWSRYSLTASNDWLDRAPAGQPVTALQHNSFLATLGSLMDRLSAPQLPGFATSAGAGGAATYHGPIAAAQDRDLPVVGFEPEPTDANRAKLWRAVCQFARRLAAYTIAQGTPPAEASTTLVGIAGPVAESIVPQMGDTLPLQYLTEDPGTARSAPTFLAGIRIAVAQALAVQAGTAPATILANQSAADTASLAAAAPLVNALSSEYETEMASDKKYALVGLAAGVGLAYFAGRYMKKTKRYVPRRFRSMLSGRRR